MHADSVPVSVAADVLPPPPVASALRRAAAPGTLEPAPDVNTER